MLEQDYRYLDSEADRRLLMADIREVRRAVLQMTDVVPEAKWYEPRYHDWSLAAMLGHLQFMDSINLLLVKMALLNIRLPVPASAVNQLNDTLSRVFQRRVVEASVRGIKSHETVIEDFVMTLPIDKFTRQVFYPPEGKTLTVEQAIQVLFLFHWRHHLETMREVEGIQPRDTSSN